MDSASEFTISTDLARIDLDTVHQWLSTDAFWALGRTRETVHAAAEGSMNFGVFDSDGDLCAYARVVTDKATFAWLCDVYVDPVRRGLGIGRLLADAVVDALVPMNLKRVMLSTLDAHGLYEQVGFVPFPDPEKLMILDPSTVKAAS
ncbi:GNAT family N-acetyltransferase [Agreia pratensis]|uniref:GNAT family N-acetyltransferase n=1 Tax=Agreia pratensis TaxID=150121 RepID=UPI00188B284A|nr:GNAT family N-acetyltransferase [Agreia pratensis]MBF4635292.1 GNAT family N-acetyltransferase [Agreia pratensis]